MNGIPHYLLLPSLIALKIPWRITLPVSVLFWAPLEPHVIGIIRGAVGELSVGSMILTALIALKIFKGTPISAHAGLKPTAILIVLTGFFLYGRFLGLIPMGQIYPYESGFSTPLPLAAIGLFGIIASWKGWLWPALWTIITLSVWLLNLHPSLNPWDSLMDPVLWIISIIFLIRSYRS